METPAMSGGTPLTAHQPRTGPSTRRNPAVHTIMTNRYVKHFLTLKNIVLCILCGNLVFLAVVALL